MSRRKICDPAVGFKAPVAAVGQPLALPRLLNVTASVDKVGFFTRRPWIGMKPTIEALVEDHNVVALGGEFTRKQAEAQPERRYDSHARVVHALSRRSLTGLQGILNERPSLYLTWLDIAFDFTFEDNTAAWRGYEFLRAHTYLLHAPKHARWLDWEDSDTSYFVDFKFTGGLTKRSGALYPKSARTYRLEVRLFRAPTIRRVRFTSLPGILDMDPAVLLDRYIRLQFYRPRFIPGQVKHAKAIAFTTSTGSRGWTTWEKNLDQCVAGYWRMMMVHCPYEVRDFTVRKSLLPLLQHVPIAWKEC